MTSECIICFEEINGNSIESDNLWKCNECNIEIHKECIEQWDTNNETNTCPHCRKTEVAVVTLTDRHIPYNINESLVVGVSRQCLYCKIISIFILGFSCSSIFALVLFVILNDYHFQYYNQTRLKY